MTKPIPEFELVEIEAGEVGEPVENETQAGTIRATWLGSVSDGKELAEAMRLMIALAIERKGEAEAA